MTTDSTTVQRAFACETHAKLRAVVEQTLSEALEASAGLRPMWSHGVQVTGAGDRRCAASRGAQVADLPADVVRRVDAREPLRESLLHGSDELLALWQRGLLYLADEDCDIDDRAVVAAERVILRATRIMADAQITGCDVLIERSAVHPRSVVLGPGVVRDSRVLVHSYLGRGFVITHSAIGQFVKCQLGVVAEHALVGSHAALEGGVHTEIYPLSRTGRPPAMVHLRRGSWVGHHASVTAGARVGEGSVVAACTHIDRDIGSRVMVAGSRSHRIPVDFHIRGSSPIEAARAGASQGSMAAEFALYGPARAGWRSDTGLELEFSDHAVLTGGVGREILDFQRGALGAVLSFLVPGYRWRISYRVGATVRFRIDFDRAMVPHAILRPVTRLRSTGSARPEHLQELEALVLSAVPSESLTFAELAECVERTCVERELAQLTPDVLEHCVRRLTRTGLLAPLLSPIAPGAGTVHDLLQLAIEDPQSYPALSPDAPVASDTPGDESPPSPERASVDRTDIARRFDAVVARVLGLSAAPEATANLADFGLGSIGFVELLVALEDEFGVELRSTARTVVPTRAALLDLVADARRRPPVAPTLSTARTRRRRAGPRQLIDLDFDAWCRLDLGAAIRRHVESPQVPWIFKYLRSSRPFDYEYLSWPQLGRRAAAQAASLAEHEISRGSVVTLLIPQSTTLATTWVGCVLAGMTPSICALPNPKLSESEFASWFADVLVRSGSRAVLCDADAAPLIRREIAKHGIELPILSPVDCADLSVVAPGRDGDSWPRRAGEHAILQHSSGTTGLKKAVLLSHRTVMTQVWDLAHALRCDHRDVIVSWLPLYHDMGLIACFAMPLLLSIPTVMMSPFDWVKRPGLLLSQLSEEGGTLCWLPNFAYLHSVRRIPEESAADLDLSSVRAVINCSEPITERAHEAFLRRFAPAGLRPEALATCYAAAETTFAITQSPPGRVRPLMVEPRAFHERGRVVVAADRGLSLVPSGVPLRGVEVTVVDAAGRSVDDGCVGEIRVRSPCLMSGYLGDPNATSAALRDGWYHTGDLGFLWDGELYVTGRKADLIIVGGQNLYPNAVEEVVGCVDQVAPGRIAVFGVFDDDLGTERLVVVVEPTGAGDTEAIHDPVAVEIRRTVYARFGVEVSAVRVVPRGTLPKSTSGKLSRNRCRQRYLAGDFG